MQVWNLLHAARWNTGRQKSPSGDHRTTLSLYIFANEAHIDNQKENMLSSNISSTCPHNMVNFGPLAAEIDPVVWGTPANSTGFASWQSYCTASSSGRQPKFAALNIGRYLCSAGRPSRWALAHILVNTYCCVCCSERKRSNLIVLVAHTDDPTGLNLWHCEFVLHGLCYIASGCSSQLEITASVAFMMMMWSSWDLCGH